MTRPLLKCCLRILRAIIFSYLFLAPQPSSATIRYTISLAHPEQHIFNVNIEIPKVSEEVVVQLPAWNGLYQIRDFSSHVRQVQAFADDKSAPVQKIDKQTWKVSGSGTVKVQYSAYWDEPGPFSAQLNFEHAFLNLALILFYVPSRREESIQLLVTDKAERWKAACALTQARPDSGALSQIRFTAATYDDLVDAPMEFSSFDEFTVPGVSPPIHVVVHGDNWKKSEIQEQLKRICLYEIGLMDGAPYHEYTFIFHIGHAAAGGGGGMEHANSTAIYVPSGGELPNVSAHEFFHLWNAKRIRPESLWPVDYTREQYTRVLWFSEGVTNTYSSYTLVRTGVWNKQEFYDDLSRQISELEARPAGKWQTVEESSLDAWLEKYNVYNSPQSSVSYYTKGQVLGVLLDLVIRERTDNTRSLDDVLRAMNADFARNGRFYRDNKDVQLAAERISGVALGDFFHTYISGAEPLPYAEVFAPAGLELQIRENKRAALGFVTQRNENGLVTIEAVDPENPAAIKKLKTGDEILYWNGGEAPREAETWAAQRQAGEILRLKVRREGKEETLEIPLIEAKERYYQVVESSHADEKAKRIREGLLRGKTTQSANRK